MIIFIIFYCLISFNKKTIMNLHFATMCELLLLLKLIYREFLSIFKEQKLYEFYCLISFNKKTIMNLHFATMCELLLLLKLIYREFLSIFKEQKLYDTPKEWFKDNEYLLKLKISCFCNQIHFYNFKSEYLQNKNVWIFF